jgi:hypothetical protein
MVDWKRNKKQNGENKDLEFAFKCFFQDKLTVILADGPLNTA